MTDKQTSAEALDAARQVYEQHPAPYGANEWVAIERIALALDAFRAEAIKERDEWKDHYRAVAPTLRAIAADSERLEDERDALVAQAVAQERERCAAVALEQRCERSFVRDTTVFYEAGRQTPWDSACVAIAAAIRSGAQP